MNYFNGDRYDGEWKNNMRDGPGVFVNNDGDMYDGNWKSDKMEG